MLRLGRSLRFGQGKGVKTWNWGWFLNHWTRHSALHVLNSDERPVIRQNTGSCIGFEDALQAAVVQETLETLQCFRLQARILTFSHLLWPAIGPWVRLSGFRMPFAMGGHVPFSV